ncbi:hypothetical protein [Nostoc sp.]|uniref:hypothetical protein n=1 Tax=Nostoc sp. TaxID=1180 RepID=UPI002FF821A3
MITEQQLKQCIAEIGLLALSTSSCVTKEIKIYEPEPSETSEFKWFPSAKVLSTAKALLELAKVFQDNWDAIQQRPLKTLTTEIAPIDIKRASYSPLLLIQAKLNPTKKQTLGAARTESYKCIENEFICYILDVYLTDLTNGIANILDSLTIEKLIIPYISHKFEKERSNFMKAVRKRLSQRNNWVDKEKLLIAETVTQLRACVQWATQARKAKFLENLVTPDKPPSPSLRLTGSPTYGIIFQQYSNCCTGNLADIEKILYLYECTYQGQVRSSWEIYKIWCVARLYSTFILYANMQPPSGKPTMFECLQVKRGTLELPKNKNFTLQGRLDNGDEFSISFCYEPELRTSYGELRIPDIQISIFISKNQIFSKSVAQYCFNVKDSDYAEQGHHQFINDVIGVASDTYLNPLNLKASFILHTDDKFDYWGEVPVSRVLKEKFNVSIQNPGYIGHKYGAISLLPGVNADRKFRKIVQLLFKYHNNSLKTSCLSCGHKLKVGEEVVPSWKPTMISESELTDRVINGRSNAGNGTGVYCSCSLCGDFWVIQICYGENHPLLKLIDCFHRNSDHPEFYGKWMYICPVCGSDPSLEDLGY